MPFDGANFVLSPQEMLASAISRSGLAPVEPHFLTRHMAEQIVRHPPGWAFRHQRAVELAQVAVLVTGVILFVALFSANRVAWGAAAAVAAFGFGVLPMLLPAKGPARWRERAIDDLTEVPAVIREGAERLQRRLPDIGFVLGELYQDRIRLDPYLLAEYGEARVILGIWDGDKVIAGA